MPQFSPALTHGRVPAASTPSPDPARATITVVIADDHPIVRRGLRNLLADDHGFAIVAEAKSTATARQSVLTLHPDVLVLDLSMGEESSLHEIAALRREAPNTQIVILTMHDEPAYARQAIGAGALGYVLKETADEDLVAAVRAAADGERYLTAKLGARLAADSLDPPGGLSLRETEVLRLLALGFSNVQVGEKLGVSVRTVETHRAKIHKKLVISDRAAMVRFALDHKLISLDA